MQLLRIPGNNQQAHTVQRIYWQQTGLQMQQEGPDCKCNLPPSLASARPTGMTNTTSITWFNQCNQCQFSSSSSSMLFCSLSPRHSQCHAHSLSFKTSLSTLPASKTKGWDSSLSHLPACSSCLQALSMASIGLHNKCHNHK